MAYNLVQTFFVPSASVGGASQIQLASATLYFKKKPKKTGNKSGLTGPTVSVQVVEATRDAPNTKNMESQPRARAAWDDIVVSAGSPGGGVVFTFPNPITVSTDKYVGLYIQFADDDYEIWVAKAGDRSAGTNSPFSGSNLDGSLFEGSGDASFRAISGKQAKFEVKALKYKGNENATATFVPENYEFLTINSKRGIFMNAERVFINVEDKSLPVPVLSNSPGTLAINASSKRLVLNNATWVTGVTANGYVILSDRNDDTKWNVAKVKQVVNTSVIELYDTPPFNTTVANGRYRVAPVAEVADSTPYFKNSGAIILYRSTANTTQQFGGGMLRGVTVSNTGAGYSNTNVIRVKAPSGGKDAVFKISTNAAGSIASLNVVDAGRGLTLTSNVRIEVSVTDSTLKAGNPGANAVVTVSANQLGGQLYGHISGATANVVSVDDKVLAEIWPVFQEMVPASGTIKSRHWFSDGNPLSTGEYAPDETRLGVLNELNSRQSVLASRSNEMIAGMTTTSSSKFDLEMQVKRPTTFLFESPYIEANRAAVITYENNINNDATNEHTNNGKALSKYITKRISFDSELPSEDLMVYLRAKRPVGTDIKVYGKFHNRDDSDPFDDKLWTELEVVGAPQFTDGRDANQWVDIEYTIPQHPPVDARLDGQVTTQAGNTVVTGVGTNFANTLIGRSVKIYNPLTPAHHQVSVVTGVTNTTQLTLATPISNNSIQHSVVGPGMRVETLKLTGTAFNDIQTDNVATYFTTSTNSKISGFDTFSVKVVLLSNNKYIVPTVNDIRMVGVSA